MAATGRKTAKTTKKGSGTTVAQYVASLEPERRKAFGELPVPVVKKMLREAAAK